MLGASPVATAADHQRTIDNHRAWYEQEKNDSWREKVEKLGLPEHVRQLMQPPAIWR